MSTRRSRADWRRVLSRQAQSGLSIAEFCRREGLSPQSLSWWRWKLREERPAAIPAAAPEGPRFVEIQLPGVPGGDGGAVFEIVLPGDASC